MLGSTNFNDISGPLWMVRTLGNSYRVAAAYVCFVMEGIMFVSMDVGVADAYVCFVMDGIMFVCMDVGVAAAYLGFAMEPYNVRVHGCRSCRWGHPSISPRGRSFI